MNFLFWLSQARVGVQTAFFELGFVALWATLGALIFRRRSIGRGFRIAARGFWGASMGAFVGMWVAGAALEMMRRGVLLTVSQLMLALAAFSFLLAFVWNLVREWVDSEGRLLGARVAGTLILLSLAGWSLGDFAGASNPLFQFHPGAPNNLKMADGWALSLAGAQLLGAAHCVGAHRLHPLRVLNPRGATLWLLAFVACLSWLGDQPRAAMVAWAAFGPFLVLSWNTRAHLPRRALKFAWLLVAISVGISLWIVSSQTSSTNTLWSESRWNLAFGGFVLWALVLVTKGRRALQPFVDESPTRGALLKATLFGAFAAAWLFGPQGALWWSFWPLAGLFFDALKPSRESNSFVDEARTNSARRERAFDEPVGISSRGGRFENN